MLDSITDFLHFYNWFTLYHRAVLLTEITWSRGRSNYCLVKPLGIYTDLNLLSEKIQAEFNKYADKSNYKDPYKGYSAEILGDVLYITQDVDEEGSTYTVTYELSYVTIDNTSSTNPPFEGWKFDI